MSIDPWARSDLQFAFADHHPRPRRGPRRRYTVITTLTIFAGTALAGITAGKGLRAIERWWRYR